MFNKLSGAGNFQLFLLEDSGWEMDSIKLSNGLHVDMLCNIAQLR